MALVADLHEALEATAMLAKCRGRELSNIESS
jgi:hypothetical protein